MTNPGQIFHVREIVRRVGEEINAVRRELAHMEKGGMVESEWRANRKFFGFKKDYIFYQDLMSMIHKTKDLGGDIVKNRNKLGRVKYAMLAGHYILGKETRSDDVDLFVVGNVILPQLAAIVKDEEAKKGREINYTVMSEEEFNFRKRRKDPFVVSILSRSNLMLLGDEEELLRNL